jgi:pimeloyl-ACP methyl ester carboxylesterase
MPRNTQQDSNRKRSSDVPHAAPFTSKFVEAGDLKLHYLDYGTAGRTPMLCIHGGAAHAHWFDFIARDFTADYHVQALDLRDFVLMGHSMGGAVSLLYAATYPGRVKTLVVIDSTVNLSADRIAKLRDVGSRPGSNYATLEELISRYRLRPGESQAAPEVVRHIASYSGRQMGDGSWKHKFDRNVYATREMSDGRPNWNRIKIPVLLVKGDRSERLSPEVYADVKARCPQAELVEVSNSDHHVTLDNPSEFVQKVKPFLAKNA